jgi:hypothetical protein
MSLGNIEPFFFKEEAGGISRVFGEIRFSSIRRYGKNGGTNLQQKRELDKSAVEHTGEL